MIRKLVLLAAVSAFSACSSMPEKPEAPKLALSSLPAQSSEPEVVTPETVSAPAPEPGVRELTARAVELLDAGNVAEARTSLAAAVAKAPRDATALRLLEQIDTDPVTLLGAKNEPYVVVTGDTMSGLAGRFLDSPLMFYALSRYNGLASPRALAVGRTLRIPVRPGAVQPLSSALTQSAPKPADPAKANAVRLQALEFLNAGDATRAVSLLTEAQALDDTSTAIRKDLERARRIRSALTNG